MRIFVTGASGFIGSAVVDELVAAGHRVVGLARSEAAADRIRAAGADVHRGSLDDVEGLRSAAAASDGVIHTAFIHDFSDFAAAAATDTRAIEAIGQALTASQRPFVVTSGTAMVGPGRVVTEDEAADPVVLASWPRRSEETALAFAERGVRVSAVRLPPSVHGEGDHGFVPMLIDIARKTGVSAFAGDGSNRWAAVHRLDAAVLFRLAIEQGLTGAHYHGVGDEGVPFREIAGVIATHLHVPIVSKTPDEAAEHFGWLARFAAGDIPASSALTQARLGWRPTHDGLLADLDHAYYFEGVPSA